MSSIASGVASKPFFDPDVVQSSAAKKVGWTRLPSPALPWDCLWAWLSGHEHPKRCYGRGQSLYPRASRLLKTEHRPSQKNQHSFIESTNRGLRSLDKPECPHSKPEKITMCQTPDTLGAPRKQVPKQDTGNSTTLPFIPCP